jgi:hypothetical protein
MAHRTAFFGGASGTSSTAASVVRLPLRTSGLLRWYESEKQKTIPFGASHFAGDRTEGPVDLPVTLESVLANLHADSAPLVIPADCRAGHRQARVAGRINADYGGVSESRQRLAGKNVLRRANPDVGVVRDFHRTTANAFAQTALGYRLHAPGEALEQEFLMVRSGLLAKQLQMLAPLS